MKAKKFLAVFLLLAASAFAQTPGLFITAGGGLAQMTTGNFSVYNPQASISGQPQGEELPVLDKKATVGVARLTVGYNFTENWALQLSYAAYGTGEARLAFPLYPDYSWAVGAGPDTYQRHVLKYKPTALTLLPSYTYAVGDKTRVIIGAGINYGMNSSHIETTTISGATVEPANRGPQSWSYAKETKRNVGYIVSLGFDYAFTDQLSAALTGNYSTFKTKIPSSPWAAASKSSVNTDSLGAELSLGWHW